MTEASTVPHPVSGLPVRTLSVEVVSGPDAGVSKTARTDLLTVGTATGNDLVLTDPTVSRYHLELLRRVDRILVRDHGSTNGTFLGEAQVKEVLLRPGAELRVGKTVLTLTDGEVVPVELHATDNFEGLKGQSPAMRQLMAQLEKVAKSDVGILLLGETGTGKERIAEAIHRSSPRRDGPFVVVDCAALHPTLVASELFGHEKGSFTGADERRIGAFERADKGTVFLDEIGEIPPAFQASLLGALERRRFRRVGGNQEIEVDVRLVSATHRDLRADVNAGTFRQDLYYRLAVLLMRVPPLRERIEDLRILIAHFLSESRFPGTLEQLFDRDAFDALESHHWPGNVRELRNLVDATIALGEAPELVPDPSTQTASTPSAFSAALLQMSYRDAKNKIVDEFERYYVERLLEEANGNAAEAARSARMDRSYLFQLIRKHQLR